MFQTFYYRWKDEAEEGAKAALGSKGAAAVVSVSKKNCRIRQMERTLKHKSWKLLVANGTQQVATFPETAVISAVRNRR